MNLNDLWQLKDEGIARYLSTQAPWDLLEHLPEIISTVGNTLGKEYEQIALQVWVHQSAKIENNCVILGPCLIEEGAFIKPHAYIRGAAWIGKHAVVGHAVEMKNAVLLERATLAHLNYVGDSIIGAYAHLGAGAVLSNLRHDRAPVEIIIGETRYPTNRRKMGALVGDFAEIGCNAVLNPGTVVQSHATVHPLQSVKGFIQLK